MKGLIALVSLLFSITAFGESLSPAHDIYVCVKKPHRGYVTSWDLVMLKKSQNVVVYQNSSNGNETDPITDMARVGAKLVVQHNGGTQETVTFDLERGNASWVEDSYPDNTQLYTDCKSFEVYDFDAIHGWFVSVVETPAWHNRQP